MLTDTSNCVLIQGNNNITDSLTLLCHTFIIQRRPFSCKESFTTEFTNMCIRSLQENLIFLLFVLFYIGISINTCSRFLQVNIATDRIVTTKLCVLIQTSNTWTITVNITVRYMHWHHGKWISPLNID